MTFCELEKDEKTFNYISKYIIWYNTQLNSKDFLQLDSRIQADEIKHHLENNNYDDKNYEILQWIKSYSKKFRIYLNTIKIVFTIWYCSGHTELMSWDEFCSIVDRIDELKYSCLDEIMVKGDPSTLDK
jgi:hypothetical protein